MESAESLFGDVLKPFSTASVKLGPKAMSAPIIRTGVVLLRRLDSRALGAEGPRAIVAT